MKQRRLILLMGLLLWGIVGVQRAAPLWATTDNLQTIAATQAAGLLAESTVAGGVNVHTSPDTAAQRITVIVPGTRYPVLEIQEGWLQIRVDGQDGWVTAGSVRLLTAADELIPDARFVRGPASRGAGVCGCGP